MEPISWQYMHVSGDELVPSYSAHPRLNDRRVQARLVH